MKALIALLLAVVVALSGCSAVVYSIEETPERTKAAFSDPVRRVHLVTQTGRLASAASVGITCVALVPPPFGFIICPFVAALYDFVSYEYLLEPMSKELVKQGKPSLVGPFWETGPRADEGEFYIDCEKPTHVCRPPAP